MSEASKSLKNVSFLKEKTGENTKQKNHQNEYVSIFCLECKLNRFDVCVYGEDGSIFFPSSQLQHPKEMQLAVGLISIMLTAKSRAN